MCKWRRYLHADCGHAEMILLDFCDKAKHLPREFSQQVRELRQAHDCLRMQEPKDFVSSEGLDDLAVRCVLTPLLQHLCKSLHYPSPTITSRRLSIDRKGIFADMAASKQMSVLGLTNRTKRKKMNRESELSTATQQTFGGHGEDLGDSVSISHGKSSFWLSPPASDTPLKQDQLTNIEKEVQIIKEELARFQAEHQKKQGTDNHNLFPEGGAQLSNIPRSRPEAVDVEEYDTKQRQVSAQSIDNRLQTHTAVLTHNDLPRFAQPTAATARRNDETLRLHGALIAEKSQTRSSISRVGSGSPTKSHTSRLPKRNGLPGAWINNEEEQSPKHTSPASMLDAQTGTPSKTIRPSYLSPTKSTISRKSQMQCSPASDKAGIRSKQIESKPDQDSHTDKMARAIASVSAASRKMSESHRTVSPTHAVLNTTTVRRTSHGGILTAILPKLGRQGLLRDDTAVQDDEMKDEKPTWQRKQSYADILREPTGRTRLRGLKGQSSAQIAKVLDDELRKPTLSCQKIDKSDDINGRVIIPSGSSCTIPAITEETYTGATANDDLNHLDTSTLAEKLLAISGQASTPSLPPRLPANTAVEMPSTLNGAAAEFCPRPLAASFTTPTESSMVTSSVDDDVFKVYTDQEWRSMPLTARQRIQRWRDAARKMLRTPLPLYRQSMPAHSTGYDGSASSYTTWSDRSNSWSPGKFSYHRGWQVTADNSARASWSGSAGREIRFTGHGVRAEERKPELYTYRNRETGQTAVIDSHRNHHNYFDPHYWTNHEDLKRLQAAIMRGYDRVPCANFDMAGDQFAVIPDKCRYCLCGY